ncbi:E3 ubiquitin-protein ligase listerin [Sitophilus oryzae]|uniref:E3 ubiquitin-protein ligase listerin n=1 Tax=Sitophilus oryzae TaxID=7048 RepID=A0A6J2Y539_SITOR|nr:E3 ubiquitin-protein ligase listerin [Sitophilus oryzae]
MGGKHKEARRTKNNTKPSSSGRSAAVLSTAFPKFAGLFGSDASDPPEKSGKPGYTIERLSGLETELTDDYQLVLKKISKKDPTTKLKGLQEFADLIKKSELDAVKNALVVWPRYYNILATDTNNRVREATHNVHREFVIKVKRDIAPHLKKLIAPWFTSQYDNYPPAATAASEAFKEAFPPAKFQDAIVFCQAEILTYIYDNLLVQTVKTIAAQNCTKEEAEAKYVRVLLSCLQGYALYLQQVPTEQIKEAAEANSKIVSHKGFWKLIKNEVPLVRAAWFQVLTVLCRKAMFLLENRETQILTIVLNKLDDGEPTVLPHVWECVLVAVSSIQEWWNYVNFEKMYLPKLVNVLKLGGQGNATIIYPSLLPLISQLEPIQAGPLKFYTIIFDNMRLGFNEDVVARSNSESVAVATAFTECLQYIINKHISDVHLCKTLIKFQVLELLEWTLLSRKIYGRPIFIAISCFAQYLGQRAYSEPYQVFLDFFFENLKDSFSKLLRQEYYEERRLEVSERQVDFLYCVKQIKHKKKNRKLKFDDDDKSKKNEDNDKEELAMDNKEMYLARLNRLIVEICNNYVDYIEEHRSRGILEELCRIIDYYNSEQFFEGLLENMKKSKGDACFMDIYENLFKKWLNSPGKIHCDTLVDLIYMLFPALSRQDRQKVLQDFLQLANERPQMLEWCLSGALSHPQIELPEVREWVHEEKIGQLVLSIADKRLKGECPPELANVFSLAFTEDKNGEVFMKNEVTSQIIEKICAILPEQIDEIPNLDSCCSVAAQFCSVVYTDSLLLTYGDQLLLTVLKLCLKMPKETERLSSETVEECKSAWRDSLATILRASYLSKDAKFELLDKMAHIVEEEFLSADLGDASPDHGHCGHLERILLTIIDLLKATYAGFPLCMTAVVDVIFNRKKLLEYGEGARMLCQVMEYVNGTLCCPGDELKANDSLSEHDIYRSFLWTYFKHYALSTDIFDESDEDDDNSSDTESPTVAKLFVNALDRPSDALVEVMRDCAAGEVILRRLNTMLYLDEVAIYHDWLQERAVRIGNAVDAQFHQKIQQAFEHQRPWMLLAGTYEESVAEFVMDKRKDGRIWMFFELGHAEETLKNEPEKVGVVFDLMKAVKEENESEFFYNDASAISCEKSELIVQIIRFCSQVIQYGDLSDDQWDFVVLSLIPWSANCYRAKHLLKNFQYQAFLVAVSNLFTSVSRAISKFKFENTHEHHVNEWEEVLLESIHTDMLQTWLILAYDFTNVVANCLFYVGLMQQFGKMTEGFECELLFRPNENGPKWTSVAGRARDLVRCSHPLLQLWGYRMLLVLVPGIVRQEELALERAAAPLASPYFKKFKADSQAFDSDVARAISQYGSDPNKNCTIPLASNEFGSTMAYLMLWDLMIKMFEAASKDLKFYFVETLKEQDYLSVVLNRLLGLMALEVLPPYSARSTVHAKYFEATQLAVVRSHTVNRAACYAFRCALQHVPALARQWWAGLDSATSHMVGKLTAMYVSPILAAEELEDVASHQNNFKNMTIKVLPSVREILAVYSVDETQMELAITLPLNYPLGTPYIQCNKQISGTAHKQWLLQFKKSVIHQNGKIWDGLFMWNNQLDKKFDGVEECYICYAVLHPGTYQLPRLSCQTCKKKFHSVCLYKWFSTSNKSTCPICRNLF